MIRGLTCFTVLVIVVAGLRPLDAQVPARRVPPPPPPRKESLRHRLLRVTGLADDPSTLKGLEQSASGQIWVAELRDQRTRGLSAGSGYRSPVFMPGRDGILALSGMDIVRVRMGGGVPERLYAVSGITKMVGFDREAPDQLLVVTENARGRPSIGWLSIKTGKVVSIPYDPASSEDRRMVEHVRGWDREYGDTSVYVKSVTGQSLSGQVEWKDVFLKAGDGKPINVSRCAQADCTQPSLSPNGQFIVFIKSEQQ